MTYWELLHPAMRPDHLGLLPAIFTEGDQRPAKEQANDRYAHGGGWNPSPNWSLNTDTLIAMYPGDPPFKPIAKTKIRDETIVLYDHGLVAIVQPDESFEMSRMD